MEFNGLTKKLSRLQSRLTGYRSRIERIVPWYRHFVYRQESNPRLPCSAGMKPPEDLSFKCSPSRFKPNQQRQWHADNITSRHLDRLLRSTAISTTP
jgi:hypothetical protein